MRDSGTPINSSEEAALEHLEQYVDTLPDDEHLIRADAVAHLMEQGSERADAREHIEQLLLKGYLYEVDDELRIPPRP
ncbi:hypothetical protein HLRTI_001371 [Halorhabdus tiamatea SARL4B]|uniref:Uncharacterized protein n=1 Tax=Halorhabdus tiamatea SARL4B TaxID=1033806 RepID=F7PJM2_9EURY|nr:hypothetical protein [Halorhabdus tiamatea]ERJ06484.1 hypothetical protein HLRTI_001371 [Halorhabdus tiamatea SARL4B]CCQ35127.1 conserved hypothetical protein [Halorhabdus tiamatea SARL4B]